MGLGIKTIVKTYDGYTFYKEDDVVQSVKPATWKFGYSYWSTMIPPFKPYNTLILGSGKGTVTDLIKLVWGENQNIKEVDIENGIDAEDYVIDCHEKYDYIVVDLYIGSETPDFVFGRSFLTNLNRISSGLVSINLWQDNDSKNKLWEYFDFDNLKVTKGNYVYFMKPKEVDETTNNRR